MIKLTYGESFTFEDHGKQVKKARDDSNGTILGDFDQFWLSGRSHTFCSYWFRTLRYIRMDIEAEQDCVVRSTSVSSRPTIRWKNRSHFIPRIRF